MSNWSQIAEKPEIIKQACEVSRKTSQSIHSIQDQMDRQKELDKKFQDLGIHGKRSLLKNFMLRNQIVGSIDCSEKKQTKEQHSDKITKTIISPSNSE